MNALRLARGIVNTSTPVSVDGGTLRRAFREADPELEPQARLFIEEVPEPVIATLVAESFVERHDLVRVVERIGTGDDERATFFRNMADVKLV